MCTAGQRVSLTVSGPGPSFSPYSPVSVNLGITVKGDGSSNPTSEGFLPD